MDDLKLLLEIPDFPVMLSSAGVVVCLPTCRWYHRGRASTVSPCHDGTSWASGKSAPSVSSSLRSPGTGFLFPHPRALLLSQTRVSGPRLQTYC
jgi:hypothetical protein